LLMENSFKIDSTKLIDKIEFSKDLHIVTRKDLTILRDILNKAMDIVTEEELLSLKRKWFGSQLKIETKKQIDFLTLKDKKYLENKKEITMCIDPNWMPYEKFDNGKHMGMSADYFKVFEKNIGINIKPIITKSWSQSLEFAKNRKCDILSLAMETPERKKYLKFTKPYLSIPLVIATKIDVPFINDIASVKNQKIGIPKGYAFVEILKNKYPNLNIIEVKNINDGLEKVNKGELFAYIGTLASIGYKFQTKYTGELKIAGKFEDKWELGIGVRDDDKTLFNILNNTVKSLDAKKQQKILNDWISIKYEKGTDYTLIWEILIIVFVIVLFLIYRQYILKKTNKKLQITVDNKTKDLKILNANLEIKIAQEVEKNLAIQEKLFNSERLAAMGEMIGNISHQWRQPLSVISTASSGMQLQKEYGMLTDEIFNSSCEAINNNAQYLSKTIDDFKNFIKGDRTKEVFNLKDNIDSFLQLVEGTIKTHHINIILNLEENIKIDGYQNELIQCFINIFNNAKDVLNKIKDEDNRLFFISVDNDEKKVTIKFRDSGGGIPKEIIAKVFDPYFTTKHKSQGTGLGLNMSHKLITEGMDGSIEVKNVQYTHNNNEYTGAEFTIILPKS
ncbi:MAG: transporter substrate-binding domain-containing protein, partial [Campylobacterota bacterium]|nr:transporter substrate-binding domain-containing protein [Campylobacterota bacterium]